jgi:Ca2+-binding RTX toxin-like protein
MVASGATLTVSGVSLGSQETMNVNGSQESAGSLRMYGGDGNDVLKGGSGADIILGGLGADLLTGGASSDLFFYFDALQSTSSQLDQITDFTISTDKIDLSEIDADLFASGDQAFSFIGSSEFGGAGESSAGQLRAVLLQPGVWLSEADLNGDGVADLSLRVKVVGEQTLTQGDFLL